MTVPQHNKGHINKPTTDFILSGKSEIFLRSGTKQGCPLIPLLLNKLLGAITILLYEQSCKRTKLKVFKLERRKSNCH
jgi:hypothetical protein